MSVILAPHVGTSDINQARNHSMIHMENPFPRRRSGCIYMGISLRGDPPAPVASKRNQSKAVIAADYHISSMMANPQK
jgi:hypothetical protein